MDGNPRLIALLLLLIRGNADPRDRFLRLPLRARVRLLGLLAQLAVEQMAKTGSGSIVNIGSIMGFVGGTGGHPPYHASNGAVRIYSKAAAVRYGPSSVRVNTVHPGYMPLILNATNAGERDDKIALTPLPRGTKPVG
jgi:NAD(P)-dependent dehydrogenase (short-subunit alcohol dehydrogenase family)